MKKRVLALALALVLGLTLAVPAAAAGAADYPIYYTNVNGDAVLDDSMTDEQSYWADFEVPGTDLFLQAISTYHYNGGNGVTPGTISIWDWDTDICLGEWQATGRDGNKWWDVFPDITLEGGRWYYVRTSSDATWSFNSKSANQGFVEIRGYDTGGDVPVSDGGGVPPSRQTAAVEVVVNGACVLWTDAWAFIDANNRTMVPLRAVAEAMGLDVSWDGVRREACFTDGARAIYFPIDSRTAYSDGGGQIAMDTAAVIIEGRTYAPIRYLAEFFGFHVDWDGATRTVFITGSLEDPYGSDDYSFAGMGIDADVDNHGQKSYRTVTQNGKTVTCYAAVSDYRVFFDDDAMPGLAGYEWRVMTIDIATPERDDSAIRQLLLSSDYYDIKQHEDSEYIDDNGIEYYTIALPGQTAEYSLWWRVDEQTAEGVRLTFIAQVPQGYDGLVVGMMNAAISDGADAGDYLYQYYTGEQDFAMFRMK